MMDRLKRYSGPLWMALGPLVIFFLVRTALAEIEKNPVTDTIIQWGVFVVIFIPIAIGLVIFGYYAWRGEYDGVAKDGS